MLSPKRATTIAIVGRAITLERESHQKRGNELIQKTMQRGLRVITLQWAIEKNKIERSVQDLRSGTDPLITL